MTRRLTGDRGAAAVELPLAVGLLLLPIAMIVMVVPQWPERQTIATAAAKEAASLYANGTDPSTGAAQAHAAVEQAAANHGLGGEAMTLSLGGEWCRACTVSAAVTVTIPAVDVPFAGSVGGFEWTATSRARVDDYRDLGQGDT